MRRTAAAMVIGAAMLAATEAQPTAGAAAPPLERSAKVDDPVRLGVGVTVPDLEFEVLGAGGATGKQRLSALLAGDAGGPRRRGAVISMTSTGCPVSRAYGPRVATIAREFADRGVAFILVNVVSAETPAEMNEFVRETSFAGPGRVYAMDRALTIAAALGARTTAEAFVVDADRRLIFRGAVDDQRGVGSASNAARREFLRDAVRALIDGREPPIRATSAPGCLLDIEDPAATPASGAGGADTVTYYGPGGAAEILARSCVECHRYGGAAPFSLESPGLIQGRARMMSAVVREGLMPPTHGAPVGPSGPGAASFVNARGLSEQDASRLRRWLDGGRPMGDPSAGAPTVGPAPTTWRIGRPDVIVSTPGLELPAEGESAAAAVGGGGGGGTRMRHGRWIVATGVEADRVMEAVEMRSNPPGAIQTAHVWLLAPGSRVPGPNDPAPGGGAEFLGAYSVSDHVIEYPAGLGRRVPAGSLLLVDAYARPMAKRMFASLRVGFRGAPAGPAPDDRRSVRSIALTPPGFWIGDGQVATLRAERVLDAPVSVVAVTPIMRSRGSRFRLEAHIPGPAEAAAARTVTLLDLPRYDWRWQIRYELREPVNLPAGTRLVATATFDNSEANPARLEVGPAAMGVGPADDLMLGVVDAVAADPATVR